MLVGDFNIPAEPRDMHPELGPYSDHYSEEERAALAGLMASYPGVRSTWWLRRPACLTPARPRGPRCCGR